LASTPLSIRDLVFRSRVEKTDCECVRTKSGPKRRRAARSSRGGPSARRCGVHIIRVEDLRRYPYRAPTRRR